MIKVMEAIIKYKTNLRGTVYADALIAGEELSKEFVTNSAVLVMNKELFIQALTELGLYSPGVEGAIGFMIPMLLDGTVFPLVLLVENTDTVMLKSCLVHELTHANQLNKMELEKFQKAAHNYKGTSLAYIFNKLEREAYWEQAKYYYKAKLAQKRK